MPLFDTWTDTYNAWFKTPSGKVIKEIESNLLTDLLRPAQGEKILDVGCGTGIFTRDVMALGPQVTGMDLSLPMLQAAFDKKSPSEFTPLCGDMNALPFKDDVFDKVFSMTAIEFVQDAQTAVLELNRVCKKGGTIVLTTLNSLSPWADKRMEKAEKGHTLFQHIFFRSPDEIQALIPGQSMVKTAIHFKKSDPIQNLYTIEESGNNNRPDMGAFLAARWTKE